MGRGSSMQRGGGRKVRALPRKVCLFLGFKREESVTSWELCWDVPAHFSFPEEEERRKPNIRARA